MSQKPAKKGKGGRKKGQTLNARQIAFAHLYGAGDKTIAAAYRAAGYADQSDHDAFAAGSKLLRNPMIREIVWRLQTEACERAGVTAEKVVARLWAEATREGFGSSHAARVAALDKLARKLGLYAADRGAEGDGAALILRLLAARPLDPPARAGEGQAGS